ncbi:ATP-grasp domain-containing protein [Bacillus cereus]|uniref:ATP-grasp domain-containing protein n=1 Tax=Bacillus cereus TaxID=1396 RepID=UPI000BF9CAD8|nr:ATP-grasp domain-containing protein [Bacillus cereus]PFO99848.1 hypothetical protein COJ97_15115 [Bacillus cereus]
MHKKLLIIGGWTELYKKAKKLNFNLTVFNRKQDLTINDFSLIDNLFTLPMDNKQIIEIVEVLNRLENFDFVLCLNEFGLEVAGDIVDKLAIKGNPIRPVQLTRDKFLMRKHLQRFNIQSIPYIKVSEFSDIKYFAKQQGFPIIVKPISGAGSEGIFKVNSFEELDLLREQRDFQKNDRIVEKFVEGREFSVEGYSWNGKHELLCVTEKTTTGAPHFVETAHIIPAILSKKDLLDIKNLTVNFLKSIGHQYGPSHTEIMLTANGPIIIESHTRAGGDNIPILIKLALGIDIYDIYLTNILGNEDIVPTVAKRECAAIKFLEFPNGIVKSIAGIDLVKSSTGIERFHLDLKEKSKITPFTSSLNRYGKIIATGKSRKEVQLNINKALEQLDIEIEEDLHCLDDSVTKFFYR